MRRWMWGTLLVLVGARSAAAEVSSCSLPAGANMFVVRYFDNSKYTSGNPLCTVAGNVISCSLSGWFYQPSGPGPFPAIVLSHASAGDERAENDYCPIVEYYVGLGYVVFQPLRRGFSGDHGVGLNSGELPDTTLERLKAGLSSRSPLAPWLLSMCDTDGSIGLSLDEEDCVNSNLQWNQVTEIRMALDFLRGLAVIDPERIALLGHGVGANITAMSALFDALPGVTLGVKAAILLSPGESSWADRPRLRELLLSSVEGRQFPLAVLQPSNAEYVLPTEDIADAAISTQDKQFMASLLPPVENADRTEVPPAQVRKRFATQSKHVNRWAPLAWRFIHLHGVNR